MKSIFLLSFLLILGGFITKQKPQGKFQTKNAEVELHFDLTLGKMQANTNQVFSTLDVDADEVLFRMEIKSFKFENPLLEKQFKDVYMESETFPHTSFEGKIKEGFNLKSTEVQKVMVDGQLTMHGVAQKRVLSATLQVSNNKIRVKSEFLVKASEHNINIPKHFFTEGKDEIKVILDAEYLKM